MIKAHDGVKIETNDTNSFVNSDPNYTKMHNQ